jgi:hypothetical protein
MKPRSSAYVGHDTHLHATHTNYSVSVCVSSFREQALNCTRGRRGLREWSSATSSTDCQLRCGRQLLPSIGRYNSNSILQTYYSGEMQYFHVSLDSNWHRVKPCRERRVAFLRRKQSAVYAQSTTAYTVSPNSTASLSLSFVCVFFPLCSRGECAFVADYCCSAGNWDWGTRCLAVRLLLSASRPPQPLRRECAASLPARVIVCASRNRARYCSCRSTALLKAPL